MIRSFEDMDWAGTWRILEPVFRAGESYPFSPDITEEDAYKVWIEIPSATYVAVDKGNEILLVVSTNETAIHLWKRHGFEVIGTLPEAFRHPQLGFVEAFV